MDLYKIKIRSSGNGWKDEKSVSGTVEYGEEIRIKYQLDGDECLFTCSEGKAVQKRRGAQNIKISFERGRYNECVIGEGGLAGSFRVFTRDISLIRGKGGLKIVLGYESGEDREKIKLELTAYKVE